MKQKRASAPLRGELKGVPIRLPQIPRCVCARAREYWEKCTSSHRGPQRSPPPPSAQRLPACCVRRHASNALRRRHIVRAAQLWLEARAFAAAFAVPLFCSRLARPVLGPVFVSRRRASSSLTAAEAPSSRASFLPVTRLSARARCRIHIGASFHMITEAADSVRFVSLSLCIVIALYFVFPSFFSFFLC